MQVNVLMKKEYDFSKAERGKFYRPNCKMNLPVYLDVDVAKHLSQVASEHNEDLSALVNRLLKRGIELAETLH
jgi:hypothetical protein